MLLDSPALFHAPWGLPMSSAPATPLDAIQVRGAATHNLRDVDLDLPRHKLTVFCGVSGSGKTSMAIDTLYAEGQRRYIESFSAYTRQFLEQLDKPDVDRIDGLPPAIAITQQGGTRSNRSTIATATEIADHLRVLFARLGQIVCPTCQKEVRADSPEAIATAINAADEGTRGMLAFEVVLPSERQELLALIQEWLELGYGRLLAGGKTIDLAALSSAAELDAAFEGQAASAGFLLVDRFTAKTTGEARLIESIETALHAGEGECVVLLAAEPSSATEMATVEIDGRSWRVNRYSNRLRCDTCATEFTTPEPQLLNPNSPLGACPQCEGFGSVVENDMDLIVPDRTKTLRQGAIAPWTTPAYSHELEELLALADDYNLPVDVPFEQLSEQHLRLIDEGVPEREFGGMQGFFRWLERKKYKMHIRVFMSRWRSHRTCDACGGDRLSPAGLAVRLGGKNLAETLRLEVREALPWLAGEALSPTQRKQGRLMLEQIESRLDYLCSVGLGYLTLNRSLRTLSSGEARRVAMASTLGSNLVDMLYVLDEPSEGLHPADVPMLADAVSKIRDRGNTVVVVEHEDAMIRRADHIVEFGPQAGVEGGEIVFQGGLADLQTSGNGSRTGDWLAGRRVVSTGSRRQPTGSPLRLRGAAGANLKQLDVDFPLGVFCVVTGVSGAGKSSLVLKTLAPALDRALNTESKTSENPLPFSELQNTKAVDAMLFIDQQPIGRSPRSNPVTYIKAFDPIRNVFAEQPDAEARNFSAGHFSFNVEGGRCEACQGVGYREVDMQFLADIFMKCRECDGRRYRKEVLAIRYRGRDISEVLEMTALEAFRFFRGHPKVQSKLKVLLDVGLDYLRLGQPANTLSGGEAQRMKLASQIAAKPKGQTLFLLDEPTTGLHNSDVVQLVDCLEALVDVGHSLIVVEHNVTMMLAADYIIDLGPGAADEGGTIVAQGTPEEVAAVSESATGRVLAEAFQRQREAQAELEAMASEATDV